MRQQHLQPLLNGLALPLDVDRESSEGRFLQDVQHELLRSNQVRPSLRTRIAYYRCALRISSPLPFLGRI